jgi:hypothetical protein
MMPHVVKVIGHTVQGINVGVAARSGVREVRDQLVIASFGVYIGHILHSPLVDAGNLHLATTRKARFEMSVEHVRTDTLVLLWRR